jgi:hypothetical protein
MAAREKKGKNTNQSARYNSPGGKASKTEPAGSEIQQSKKT